jgi:hypothetical protein
MTTDPRKVTTGIKLAKVTPPPSAAPVKTVIPEPTQVPVTVVVDTLPKTQVEQPKAKPVQKAKRSKSKSSAGSGIVKLPNLNLSAQMNWVKYGKVVGSLFVLSGIGSVIAFNTIPVFRVNALLNARNNLGYYSPECAKYKSGNVLVLRKQDNPLPMATGGKKTLLQFCQSGIPNGTLNGSYLGVTPTGKLTMPSGISFKLLATRNFVPFPQGPKQELDLRTQQIETSLNSEKDPIKKKALMEQLTQIQKDREALAVTVVPWLEFGATVIQPDGKTKIITDLSASQKAELDSKGVTPGILYAVNSSGEFPDMNQWEKSPSNSMTIGISVNDPIYKLAMSGALEGARLVVEDLSGI